MSAKRKIGTMGPKVSLRMIAMSWVTSVITVCSRHGPPPCSTMRPPVTMVEPLANAAAIWHVNSRPDGQR